MSVTSFPIASRGLRTLAEGHFKQDLLPEDRSTLQRAATIADRHTNVGVVLGSLLGGVLAFRGNHKRFAVFKAFGALGNPRPTHVIFIDGKLHPVPDLEPLLRSATRKYWTSVFIYPLPAMLLGGLVGSLSGHRSASAAITKSPETKERIELAFRERAAIACRQMAQLYEQGGAPESPWSRLLRRGK